MKTTRVKRLSTALICSLPASSFTPTLPLPKPLPFSFTHAARTMTILAVDCLIWLGTIGGPKSHAGPVRPEKSNTRLGTAHFIDTDSGTASLSLTYSTSETSLVCFALICFCDFAYCMASPTFQNFLVTEGRPPETFVALKQHPAKKKNRKTKQRQTTKVRHANPIASSST